VRSTPVELPAIAQSFSRNVAPAPAPALVVDPSAFAASLIGCAARAGPTLILQFHSSLPA